MVTFHIPLFTQHLARNINFAMMNRRSKERKGKVIQIRTSIIRSEDPGGTPSVILFCVPMETVCNFMRNQDNYIKGGESSKCEETIANIRHNMCRKLFCFLIIDCVYISLKMALIKRPYFRTRFV